MHCECEIQQQSKEEEIVAILVRKLRLTEMFAHIKLYNASEGNQLVKNHFEHSLIE